MYLTHDRTAYLQTHPTQLADLLPWVDFVAPSIVLNTDGSLQATIELVGPDLRSQPDEIKGVKMLQVNTAIYQLDCCMHSETQHYLVPAPAPKETWAHPIAQRADEERRERFTRERLLESRHFVTLTYYPPEQRWKWLHGLAWKPSQRDVLPWQQAISPFRATVESLVRLLQSIMVDVQLLNDEETWNFLHSAINRRRDALKLPSDTHDIAFKLDGSQMFEEGDRKGELLHGGATLRTITVSAFPPTSMAVMLSRLNDITLTGPTPQGIEHRWVMRWNPFSDLTAGKRLRRERSKFGFHKFKPQDLMLFRYFGHAEGHDDPMADVNMDDAAAAQIDLRSGRVRMGALTLTGQVWDHDPRQAEAKALAVQATLAAMGFRAEIETHNALAATLGTYAGMTKPNPRKPTLESINVAQMMQVDATWSGLRWNDHWQVPPLFVAKTSKTSPFRYVPHVDDVAHTLIFGPTGRGKSALLNWMRLMLQSIPDAQDIGFDVKGSSMVTTLCLGGKFYDLATDTLPCQPLREIDSHAGLTLAQQWVADLIRDQHITLNARGLGFIMQALTRLAAVEPSGRTMTGLSKVMAQMKLPSTPALHKENKDDIATIRNMQDEIMGAIRPFTREGVYGRLLDSSYNGLNERVIVFEMEGIRKAYDVAKPVLRAINMVLATRYDGRPTLKWNEEVHTMLDIAESVKALDEEMRMARDKNIWLLASTQNTGDMMKHPLAQTFIDNAPVKIFLPNDEATSEANLDMYLNLQLTYPQVVHLSQARRRAEWMIKSPDGTRLVENVLDPFALSICGRSGKKWNQQAQEIVRQVGADIFPVAWLEHLGRHDDAAWVKAAMAQQARPPTQEEEEMRCESSSRSA